MRKADYTTACAEDGSQYLRWLLSSYRSLHQLWLSCPLTQPPVSILAPWYRLELPSAYALLAIGVGAWCKPGHSSSFLGFFKLELGDRKALFSNWNVYCGVLSLELAPRTVVTISQRTSLVSDSDVEPQRKEETKRSLWLLSFYATFTPIFLLIRYVNW